MKYLNGFHRKYQIKLNQVPATLTVSYPFFWRRARVQIDSNLLYQFTSIAEFTTGKLFQLSDGSLLSITLKLYPFDTHIEVLQNNVAAWGTDALPLRRVRSAIWIMTLVALFNLIVGATSLQTNFALLKEIGLGYANLIAGGLFALISLATYRTRSGDLILYFCLLFLLEWGFTFYSILTLPELVPSPLSVIVRLFVIRQLYLGLLGARDLEARGDHHQPIR